MNSTINYGYYCHCTPWHHFIFDVKKKRNQCARTLQTLLGFAERQGSQLTQHDNMDNLAIGFSEKNASYTFLK
jgi:hypothetical protein